MTSEVATEDLAAIRAAGFIRRGQQAWTEIKKTAEEQRTLWLEVGVALMYGKQANPSNQAFGKWCVEAGFGDIDRRVRADAMWLAENSADVQGLDNAGLSHPTAIRAHHGAAQATQALPEDLKAAPPPTHTTVLPQATAAKVNKLHHRSTTNDEGSDIAARMVRSFAKAHGLDVDQLLEAAALGDPDGRHRFSPPLQQSIDLWRDRIRSDATAMAQGGMSLAVIRHLLINLANSL